MTGHFGARSSNRLRIVAWATAACLLVLPWLAMQVTDEVVWDLADFAIHGTLLATVGIICEIVARKTDNVAYRTAVGVALTAAFLLIVINLAVGIIGSSNDGANLMFGGVLAAGLIGAIIARFRARGMARAMVVTAFMQALVAVIALVSRLGDAGPIWPRDVLGATGFFVALWLLSAWLFRRSLQDERAVISRAGTSGRGRWC